MWLCDVFLFSIYICQNRKSRIAQALFRIKGMYIEWNYHSSYFINWTNQLPWNHKSSHQKCSVKNDVVRNFATFTGKHLCQRLFFNKVAGLRLVFSCEFCEISKNTFFIDNCLWNQNHLSCFLKSFTEIKLSIQILQDIFYFKVAKSKS